MDEVTTKAISYLTLFMLNEVSMTLGNFNAKVKVTWIKSLILKKCIINTDW